MDPDPATFILDLQDVNKQFFRLLLFQGTLKSFFLKKVIKKSQTVGIKVILTIFA
jgi:hypothetical protein